MFRTRVWALTKKRNTKLVLLLLSSETSVFLASLVSCVFELPPQMREVHSMLGEKLRADEYYRHVIRVARKQDRIIVDVHFA